MRKFLFAIVLFFSSVALPAQNIHLFITGGMMNYQGDLQSKRFTLKQSHAFAGFGAYYEVTDQLYIRAGFLMGKVSGDDKLSTLNKDRNLNFFSQVMEFHVGAEYDLINSYEHTITPYLYAAVAGYHFDPYTFDAANKKVYLQPLGTEGQGFGGRKKYSLTQLSIPFGGGVKMPLTDNIYLRLEGGLRKLFTDYLDDVSTFYVSGADLLANNGQQAVDLSFRKDELQPSAPYPDPGAKRGNPKSKDFYYTLGFTLSFRLAGNDGKGKAGKGKLGCPVNVY
jgi:hypothetical protein